jgi:hypothetical protein
MLRQIKVCDECGNDIPQSQENRSLSNNNSIQRELKCGTIIQVDIILSGENKTEVHICNKCVINAINQQ